MYDQQIGGTEDDRRMDGMSINQSSIQDSLDPDYSNFIRTAEANPNKKIAVENFTKYLARLS